MSMHRSGIHNQSGGLTFIELIVVIVILGVGVPVLIQSVANNSKRTASAESITQATFYAQQMLEEVQAKVYDEQEEIPWSNSSTTVPRFGPDTDETSSNKDTFDDIDDYVGCTDNRVTTPAAGYTRTVSVDYAYLNGATWTACGAVTCASDDPPDCTACSACCFKRITVKVSRTNGIVKDVSLVTIVASN